MAEFGGTAIIERSSSALGVRFVGLLAGTGLLFSLMACSSGSDGTGQPAAAPANGAPAEPGSPATPGIVDPGPGAGGPVTMTPPTTPDGTPVEPAPVMPTPGDPVVPVASCSTLDPASGAAPIAYLTSCASCHGSMGEGKGPYPSLRTPTAISQLTTIVRSGRTSQTITINTSEGHAVPGQMPAFSPERLSDGDVLGIAAYLSAPAPATVGAAQHCLSRPEAAWTPAQIDEAYQRGLIAWRTAGDVDGNACVSCHGADPMDLASIGYTDAQIYRRAFNHTSQPIADDVVDMVHAMRAKYNIVDPPDPATFRPFQPGGEVLPGATAPERDRAFGQELQQMGMKLMGAPINSAADAHAAWDELKALNLRTLKVGIPMNRYTEDIYNNPAGMTPGCADNHMCDDHGTIADWIPDVPVLEAGDQQAMFALHDTYLASPTLENLKAILRSAPRDNVMWFKNKYLAVQIANFLFRQRAQGDKNLEQLPAVPFPVEDGVLFNGIWMVGANTRDFIHNVGDELPTGGGKFSVPEATIPGLALNNAEQQLQRVIVPWFWLGFTFDPSTMNVEPDYVAEADEYFTQQTFLDSGSSPIHAAFIVSKRSVEMMAYDELPRSPHVFPFYHPDMGNFPVTPMTMRSGYFPVLTNFAEEKNFNTINDYQFQFMPTDPEQKTLFQTYTANMYRMFMWTLIDELQTTPQIWNPDILEGKIHKAELFLTSAQVDNPNRTQDEAMLAQARSLAGAATVMQ